MFDLLRKKSENNEDNSDFGYITEGAIYLDSSCQTLRPRAVLDAQRAYYEEYNACGGRVKYEWGAKVDREVEEARTHMLKFVGKSPKEYFTAFTQSTTYGINLILSQLKGEDFDCIVTTDVEHNSVFLPTVSYAEKSGWERVVISRAEDGSLDISQIPEKRIVFVANTVSNIDGRALRNIRQIVEHVHNHGGIVILDGAQSMTHDMTLLGVEYDALCTSGHKMYAPSLGIIVAKRSLLSHMDFTFVGGGMVEDVEKTSYSLLPMAEEPWAMFEPGLQDWAAIIGLKAAIIWLGKQDHKKLAALSSELWKGLGHLSGISLLNKEEGPIVSFYLENIDSHRAAQALGTQGIMVRSGYFCCHYYLKHVRKLPPLVRVSLGCHNTSEDIRQLISKLSILLNTR